MSKIPALFLFGPDDIEGAHVQNAHIFDGTYDTETKKWTYKDPSRCGKMESKSNTNALISKTNSREFCHAVVDGQDQKFNACGMCMASFFADEE